MVKRLALFVALLASMPTAIYAAPQCTPGSEYEPPLCAWKMPPVRKVVIEENAAKSSLETDASVDCSGFVVTERLVRRYLARAKQVQGDAHSTLDWSACHATGKVEFVNGQSARWHVSQLRVGSLIIDGQAERTLFCPACKEKPFAW